MLRERRAAMAAYEEALRSSRQYADRTAGVLSRKQQQRAELVDTYWQLMRSGETNASACRVLGMSRRSGTTIEQRTSTRRASWCRERCGRAVT